MKARAGSYSSTHSRAYPSRERDGYIPAVAVIIPTVSVTYPCAQIHTRTNAHMYACTHALTRMYDVFMRSLFMRVH